ncbi:MAG: methionine--tRNA ligase [Sediminibacterium sp.]|nr:methionine--tRNA ligase [Sediminibacterium sp.]
MKQPKRYLITAALPYANGLKHIGHLAGAYLPADIYVRYLRAQKRDVVFVCGSDEHGTAIPIQATKEGTTAQAIIDKYHPIIEQNFNDLGISFDIYHRTSSPIHHETASEFFTALNKKGDLITKESEQYYDEQAQSFLADRYIKGTCPNCGFQAAYGDQCESCGKSLSPDELINPVSTLSGNTPVKKLTKHWYLPLDRHEDFLRKWIIEEHGNDWRSTVVGQCKSWIDGGLQPRAVTRDLDWGVALPNDVEGGKGKVLYVWFDAPIGYISATKQWALNTGKDWRPYWEDQDTKLIHFIGKDNIVFHCIIFPVMLQLHGNILPTNVPANEFMNLEGDKMSTSRNWKLEMEDYINDFIKPENGGSQLADTLRYYLTAIAPESKDSEFTWKGFQDANNSELVSIFGNFINRALVLMHKLCNGKVPPLHNELLDELDHATIEAIQQSKQKVEQLLEDYKFRDAQFEVINLARIGNQYMQKKEPWILAKQLESNPAAQQLINNCLHICLQLTANLAILSNPFLPFTAKKICYLLKVVDKILDWENAGSMKLLSVGYSLRAPELLFRKIEDEEITNQIEKLKAAAVNKETIATTTPAPAVKPEIVFDDFAKIDLKVGTIVAAEKVEKADKLLKLQVDLGFETRTIVSGIAMHFAPADIVGKQVTVVCNLAPRKMRGIESNGMILMAEDANGKLHFINPEDNINPGSGVS